MTIEEYKEKFKELIPLQKKHLEILKYINDFCDENDIEWCLVYGSALGACRHGGPIPWDDDVDIAMTAKEYEKFKEKFYANGDRERFYLQEKVNIDGMVDVPKIRMNGTAFIEETVRNCDLHQGIYVDIFILHNAPSSKLMRSIGKIKTTYLQMKILSNYNYQKRKAFKPLMAFLRLFPKKLGMKSVLKFQYKYDKKPSEDMVIWEIPASFIPKEVVFPIKRINYDGVELCVLNQLEKYLELHYGKWENIPSLDKIMWDQHTNQWSTTEDFRKFVPNIHDFSDEMGDKKQ